MHNQGAIKWSKIRRVLGVAVALIFILSTFGSASVAFATDDLPPDSSADESTAESFVDETEGINAAADPAEPVASDGETSSETATAESEDVLPELPADTSNTDTDTVAPTNDEDSVPTEDSAPMMEEPMDVVPENADPLPEDTDVSGNDSEDEVPDDAESDEGSDAPLDTHENDLQLPDTSGDAAFGNDAAADTEETLGEEAGSEVPTNEPSPDNTSGENTWNITDTKRPGASDTVSDFTGSFENKTENQENRDWSVLYDADRDVYKITFNIGKDAEKTQVVDLTKALDVLQEYADSEYYFGEYQKALDEAKAAVKKPVKAEFPPEPVNNVPEKKPEEPKAPGFEDEHPKPQFTQTEPVEPGKPEGFEANLEDAWSNLEDTLTGNGNFENSNRDYVLENLAKYELDASEQYIQNYADYIVNKADLLFTKNVFGTRGEIGGVGTFKYFMQLESSYNGKGEPTDEQIAEAIASVQRQLDALTEPEYEPDKDSQAYKDYISTKDEYERLKEEYENELTQWETDKEKYESEQGDSPQWKEYLEKLEAYQAEMKAYETAVAEYEAAVAAYNAAVKAIEAQFDKDTQAYRDAIQQLERSYETRKPNVLEPGDVLKFELFITSDSKHTYRYKAGSFTLATPDHSGNGAGVANGFDGQDLPSQYIDNAKYYVTTRSEPIQKMFEAVGMDYFDRLSSTGSGYYESDIKEFLSRYEGETLAEQLDNYILAYYGNEYDTIDDLIRNNAEARAQLSMTTTDGNKWLTLNGQHFQVDAHLETVLYDDFYKNLFSFAFGSEADIDEVTGGKVYNPGTGRFEYDNKSWTLEAQDGEALKALYYYMDHKEIWQQTDAYFKALLDGGLTAEEATWTSLMMAVNISGFGTGNDWQNTAWPWYSSIQLEQMDIDFTLTKKDGETGETITSSETEFKIWYIDNVKQENGDVVSVNMYCAWDPETNSYTFVPDESTVWTTNGELHINYAMMKDIVYYLQEITAPEGYERDTNVYIIMNEPDYEKLSDKQIEEIENKLYKELALAATEEGLTWNADFTNVKIVTPPRDPDPDNPPPDPEDPPEEPEDPETPPDYPTPDEPQNPEEPSAELPGTPTDETAGWNQTPWVPDWIIDEDEPQAFLPGQPEDETAGWNQTPWVPDWIVDEPPTETPEDETLGWRKPATPEEEQLTLRTPLTYRWRRDVESVPHTDDSACPITWALLACGASLLATATAARMRRARAQENR